MTISNARSTRGATTYGVATGGTSSRTIVVASQNYTELLFNDTAALSVSKAGLFDVMLLAGGGGGGDYLGTVNVGGGGGGGVITSTIYLDVGTNTITLGAGGAAQVRGNDTSLGSVTVGATVAPVAVGGGPSNVQLSGGAGVSISGLLVGGSAGGQVNNRTNAGQAIVGQGFAGGIGQGSLGDGNGAGGGGGGSAVGANGTASVGGAGGAGFDASAWRGEVAATTVIAGGGGGQRTNGSSGAGGTGGGGAASNAGTGTAGAANKGGGGGGGNGGAAGGKGVAYIRFKI